MIRVLQVVTTMDRGGLETMIMNYYRNINREKIQFDFIEHRSQKSAYDDEIESLGGKIYRLSVLNPFSKSYKDALNSFFKDHPEYQIIHVHQDCLSSVILKVAKENGVKVRIAHSHSSSQDKNLKYLIKLFYKRFIPKYATDLLACGKAAGDWMFNGAPYLIMNNAVNSDLFKFNLQVREQVRNSLNIQNNLIIGHVGRFNYPKNHTFLIDIFNAIHSIRPDAKLLLVGSGELMDEIKEKASSLGLSDSVIFLGNRSDVNELMQAMDIFVFPSNYEGLPVTLVEAQASGLPIFISTNVPDQCIITPNVMQISLKTLPEEWSKTILKKYESFNREDTTKYIIDAHFDIKENAKWLENYYLEKLK